MIRRRLPGCLLLAAAWLAAPAAAPLAQERTLRWGNNTEVTTMDPHGAFSIANAALLGNIYEALVRHDADLRFTPALATGWTVVAPDLYRFAIREGVRFHDGTPLTAADVVASLRRAALPNSPYAAATHMIREVRQTGPLEVEVALRGPYPVLINDIAGVAILSERWLTENDALEPANPARDRTAHTSTNTNGTGPFRLVSRTQDSETVLERNPLWWDRAEHGIDRAVFRPIPSDATRVAALLSGQIDFLAQTPLQDVDRIRRDPAIRITEAQDLRVVFLGFNVSAAHKTESGTNPLADRRVREAMAAAIDIEAITRTVMRGLTRPTNTIIAREIAGWDASLDTPRAKHDPARARQLLAEAGYPDGFAIGLDCPNDRFVNGERVCQAAAAMWTRVGIRVTLNAVRYPVYFQKFINGQSDSFLAAWANTPQLDGFSILNNVFHTRTERHGSWNAGRVSDPAFDSLVERLAVEMDPARRQAMLTEAFRTERDQVWTLPLYREPIILAMRQGFDVTAQADGRVRLWMARAR